MRITIGELNARVTERTAQKKALAARVADLETKQENLNAQAQAAAEAGNVDAYKKVKAALTDLDVELLVAKTQLSKMGSGETTITEEEAAEAWEDYRKGYEEKFSSLLVEYEQQKAELLSKYGELVDLQAEGCKTREKIAGYRGINTRGDIIPLDSLFPMSCLPVKAEGHETLHLNGTLITKGDPLFYMASLAEEKKLIGIDYVQDETLGTVKAILWQHSSKPF